MTTTMYSRGMARRGLLQSGMAMTAVGLILPAGMGGQALPTDVQSRVRPAPVILAAHRVRKAQHD